MWYIPELFIETTVFNFYFEEKQGQKQRDAIMLFEKIGRGAYKAYTSQEVVSELQAAPGEKSRQMDNILQEYTEVLNPATGAHHLADRYITAGIIPAKFDADALHIATAVVHNLDFVVSFNMGHIVKLKTVIGTGFVNLRQGYRQIGLCTPTEVLAYDR